MPTPEQERPLSAEQARQPSFEERLRSLIEPKKNKEGQVLQEAAIRNEKLQRLGRLALEPRNQTPEGLGKLLGKGDDWCLDEQVPEDEWSVLAGEFGEERERLLREKEGERKEKLVEEEKPSELLKTAARYTKEMKELEMEAESLRAQAENLRRQAEGEQDPQKREYLLKEATATGEKALANLQRIREVGESLSQQIERKAYSDVTELDEILGQQGEKPPRLEEAGPEGYRAWFNERLYALLETNKGKNFEADWYLLVPLERAKIVLPPKGEKDTDEIVFQGEKTGITYRKLREELSQQLEAFRNVHNYIYFHDRASGTPDLVAASQLLSTPNIEYLLRYKDGDKSIADNLRNLERLAEEYKKLIREEEEFDKEFDKKHKDLPKEEKKRAKKALGFEKAQAEKRDEIYGEINRKEWDALVAGYLFRGLEEAARYDLNFGGGDFFLARIFNAQKRARKDWETKWGRDTSFMEIADACDLGVPSFWSKLFKDLEKERRENRGEEEFNVEKYGVVFPKEAVKEQEEKEKKEEKRRKINDFSLAEARFENMDLGALPDDQLKQGRLDIDDAENVRKIIFNPGGLLQVPSLGTLVKTNPVFKHLSGDKRYEWYQKMATAIINYYKDNTRFLFIEENVPRSQRRSASKKDFPDVEPWTAGEIKWKVEALPPLLRDKEVKNVLKATLGSGWKAKINTRDVGVAVAKGIGTTLWEVVKAALGVK